MNSRNIKTSSVLKYENPIIIVITGFMKGM